MRPQKGALLTKAYQCCAHFNAAISASKSDPLVLPFNSNLVKKIIWLTWRFRQLDLLLIYSNYPYKSGINWPTSSHSLQLWLFLLIYIQSIYICIVYYECVKRKRKEKMVMDGRGKRSWHRFLILHIMKIAQWRKIRKYWSLLLQMHFHTCQMD